MTIKELKKELERFDENEIIYIEYECGNGKIMTEVQKVYWDADRDNNGTIIICGH